MMRLDSYPWEEAYKAAVLEVDNASLEQRVREAEQALLTRWLDVTDRHEHKAEVQGILDAVKALQKLKRERLGP
jgi:hypothetical protein